MQLLRMWMIRKLDGTLADVIDFYADDLRPEMPKDGRWLSSYLCQYPATVYTLKVRISPVASIAPR